MVYPEAVVDPQVGKPKMRGPICQVCTRKFMVHELVTKTHAQLKKDHAVMQDTISQLQEFNLLAKSSVDSIDDFNQQTLQRITEVESEN